MSDLKQQIKDLETEYRLLEKQLMADGLLDENDKKQLAAFKATINKLKSKSKNQKNDSEKTENQQPQNEAKQANETSENTNNKVEKSENFRAESEKLKSCKVENPGSKLKS